MSINYFLRNGARSSQKRTFVRRQWAQHLLFLFFTQHLFQSIWSLMFDVNQLFSQKCSPEHSKANFCSKTVGTVFAVFGLHSTSFPINLIIIVYCNQFFSQKWSLELSKASFCSKTVVTEFAVFCSSFNIFPNHFDYYCLLSINCILRKEARSSQKRSFARRQWAQ